jgi:large subunit ribosomal protein L3
MLGIKKGMSAGYDSRGRRVAVTMIQVTPNFVVGERSKDKDGYEAFQIATGSKKSVNKPQKGQFKKAGAPETLRFMREVSHESGVEVGAEVKLGQVFKKGDALKITGVSKGRGFQGGVRRHGFHGGPKTHGQSDRHRAPGSIGSGTTPGRVLKGKRMAGHMGVDQVSQKNVEVIEVDKANDMLIIKGGVPGPIGGLIRLENIGKIKGYVAPPEEKEDEEEVENVKGEEVEKTENVSSEENAVQAEEVKAEEETTETKVEDKEEVAAEATVAEEKVEAPVAEETQVEEKENA